MSDAWAGMLEGLRSAAPAGRLAAHHKAAQTVAEMLRTETLPANVRPLRLGVLRTMTAEVLGSSLVAALAEFGFAAELSWGRLGNIAEETLRDDSFVYRESLDGCVVLALAEHVLPGWSEPAPEDDPAEAVGPFVQQVEHLADRFSGWVVVANFAWVEPPLVPHLQAQWLTSARYAVEEANRRLAECAARHANLIILDVAGMVQRLGTERFWSLRDQLASMQPFSAAALPLLAARLAEVCTLYLTTPVKCIVLDCDNTLWGGIVGEDGLHGLQLGETYPGLCYQRFQQQLGELNRLGFLLAINSKNNPDDVKAVFEQHPGMVLRWEQLAAVQINWNDKAANMRALAEELNIGLDSFVFIDDSAFEINLIREQVPEVRCRQVPSEPWRLPLLLPEARVVDRLSITPEDRKKATMYTQQRRRRAFQSQAGSLEDYLRGLDIRMRFEPFDAEQHLARTAQLTQKTNQFNLTTRRYTEAEILQAAESGARIFLASLSDRFGDYGRIALALVEPDASGKVGKLAVYLLSCRVIGRGVEDAFIRLVMCGLRERGFEVLEAEFIPTRKNQVCAEFLPQVGFDEVSCDDTGHRRYRYDLRGDIPAPGDWITLV